MVSTCRSSCPHTAPARSGWRARSPTASSSGRGITPDVITGSLALIAEGAEPSGRTLADIEVWFTCFWFVDERPGAALAEGAWAATSFAMHFSRGRVTGKFVPDECHDGIAKLGEHYDLVAHGRVTDDLKQE